ncbi:hypothetical protein [Goodfellowiella coeruleoviolacea]|uniref:Uncharacterized protein n=1 Tax=Goodfellowiella coeruleoviolacea TaxID=334858 RepID=A0AAE3KFU8_9PSEU|nr:hypothetical protein [Goodfellowiella coeruleoviolacea]MCP2164794.1 hypothetical protein [Goodfellowiella coeruleoviolacea]
MGSEEKAARQRRIDIKPTQVIAGALAAVAAAVLGSQLGVAGTVVGAAMASVISTVGTTLLQHSIDRTRATVRQVSGKAGAAGDAHPAGHGASTRTAVVDRPPAVVSPRHMSGDLSAPDAPDAPDAPGGAPAPVRRRAWVPVAVVSALVFVVGMLVVTGVEWMRGQPLAGGQGTTLSRLTGGSPQQPATPGPATGSTQGPGSGADPQRQDTESAAPTTGTTTPTTTGPTTAGSTATGPTTAGPSTTGAGAATTGEPTTPASTDAGEPERQRPTTGQQPTEPGTGNGAGVGPDQAAPPERINPLRSNGG